MIVKRQLTSPLEENKERKTVAYNSDMLKRKFNYIDSEQTSEDNF